MKLSELDLDLKAATQYEVNQLIREMATQTDDILFEGEILQEGVKALLRKGKNQVNDILRRGRVELDQVKMDVMDRVKDLHGETAASNLMKVAARFAKPAMMVAVVGAAMLGTDTAGADQLMDTVANLDPSRVQDYVSQPSISPKLLGALTDQMDGIFKASTADGLKTLTGSEAVETASQAHGVPTEDMIEHLMKNVNNKEDLVAQFKKWVGAGIKKQLGM